MNFYKVSPNFNIKNLRSINKPQPISAQTGLLVHTAKPLTVNWVIAGFTPHLTLYPFKPGQTGEIPNVSNVLELG